MYDSRPHVVEALRLVVCPFLFGGNFSQQRCGALRELMAGHASIKHFKRYGNVENAVFLSESATGTREGTGQTANR